MEGKNKNLINFIPQLNSPNIDPARTMINNKQLRCVLGDLKVCGIKIPRIKLFNPIETIMVENKNNGVLKKPNMPSMIIDLVKKTVYTTT